MSFWPLTGLAIGAAVMLATRSWSSGALLIPIAVAIGPLLAAWRGHRPSRTFVTLYVVVAAILFALMAFTGPGFRSNFDPP